MNNLIDENVMADEGSKGWSKTIKPITGWFDIRLAGLWGYRDLIMLFVRRDFVAIYKQTILGPLWYLIQPIMMTLIFTIIFGKVAKVSTDGLPPVMFYLSGVIVWRYFSDCLQKTSNTFVANAHMFGKVYFPRLTIPLSIVISNLISFGLQLGLFSGFWIYFFSAGATIQLNFYVYLLPLLILQMAALSLGCGIIVASLTTKYRDLTHLVGFGLQVWMYATPVVYPSSIIPEKYNWLMVMNPMVSIIEVFRYAFLGVGTIKMENVMASVLITIATLLVGIVLFSRVEKSFMDTV